MHLSDKDLDRLSREAAEQYDVEQNTSGWDKLEQKLNKHLPAKDRKERRRFLFFIWIFAFLTGGGLVWMLTGNHTRQAITLKEGSTQITQVPSESNGTDAFLDKSKSKNLNIDDKRQNPDDQKPLQDQQGVTTENRNTTQTENKVPGNEPANNSQKSDKDVQKSGPTPASNEANFTGKKPVQKKSKNKPVRDAGIGEVSALVAPVQRPDKKNNSVIKDNDASPVTNANKAEKEVTSAKENPSANTEQNEKALVADSSNQHVTKSIKSGVDSGSTVKKMSMPKGRSGFDRGLVVGAVGAPDMSNVKFTNTDKVGYNFGIQLEYRISQRWSANTGVIYTQKNYTSQGEDFNPPKGSWIDNVKLDLVEGTCDMFDIPLNVRYDLNQGNKHRYFLSTGLSTYLMKNEEYHYHYQYTNGSPGYRYRTYAADEHHWFSILNISAGFEKKISKRFSLQGEPYLKIPLVGVGYGNLQLNSYGVYFSLRYNTGALSGKK